MSVETSNIPQKNEQGSFSEVQGSYCVRDISLAEEGRKLIDWAEANMPVMMHFRKEFEKTKPFAGYRLAGCLHVTKETAVLIETFKAAGAEVYWSGCNPLSTNDAVAAALAAAGISIYAWHGNHEDFYWCIDRTLDNRPHLTLDDGCDLINTVHEKMIEYAKNDVIGGTEETTTGVHRLRARSADGKLYYPVFAVNDAETKWDFDNVYGTGQSTLDGILRATSVMLAGKNFVVAGHGHCGAGVAKRASGMGSNVIITEVCNTGHYDCEINIGELDEISVSKRTIRQNCEEYTLKNGNRIYVLAEGRLVNLAAAEGHPSEVMDMSFANQFLCHVKLVEAHRAGHKLPVEVIDIPVEQDEYIAELKLKTMGLSVDILTQEQIDYATNYQEGT